MGGTPPEEAHVPLDVNEVVRFTANFTLDDGSLTQNVYHAMKIGSVEATNEEVVEAIEDWVEEMYVEIANRTRTGITPALSSIDKEVWVTDKWMISENIGVYTPTFTPSDAAVALPNQSSCFVTFKTARPTSIGRKFLFPMTSSNVIGGILTGTLVTSLTAYAAVAVNNFVMDILNELVPGVPRTSENTFLPFTLAVVTNVSGSQRRRRPGTGA